MKYYGINFTAVLLIVSSAISISPLTLNYGILKPSVISLLCLLFVYAIKMNLFSWTNVAFIAPTIAIFATLTQLIFLGFSVPYWEYLVFIVMSYVFINYRISMPNESFFYKLTSYFLSKLELLRVSRKAFLGLCLLFILASINSFYWGEFTIRLPIYFYSIFFILFSLSKSDLYDYTNYLSRLMMLLLIGALIGFVYAIGGGEALFKIPNEDSRQNGFYLSTLSNTYLLGLIRPSGIFDEPGALSFFICMTVALRESLGLSRKTSWVLLGLGLISTSLAHLIFMAIYWLKVEFVSFRRVVVSTSVILTAILFLTIVENPFSTVIGELIKKFEVVDGVMAGDNRSALIFNALSYLDARVFFFGLDSDCMLNLEPCSLKGYSQYGENPFTLLVHWGIFLALPYFFVLGYLIKHFITNKNLIALAVFLLLLQRPNLMSYGYAVLIMIYVYSLMQSKSKELFYDNTAHAEK
jgi:hypothetical protein